MGSRHRVLSSSRHSKTIMTKAVFFSSVIALAAGMVALLLLNVEPSEAATSNLCKNTSVVNHDACKAFSTQYKCAVFYTDLETDSGNRPLSWIGGLPDALAKPAVNNSAEIRATFGNLQRKNFWLAKNQDQETFCQSETAEARCYVAMQETADRPLDSCEVNIINEEGYLTLGDLLCENLVDSGWISEGNRYDLQNQVISFYYSVCKKGWKQITGDGKALVMKEPLCCKVDSNDKYRYYRCDGSSFDSSSKCKK